MIKRNADHENTLAFGPCAAGADDRSFFCQGAGVERLDPADVFGLGTVIMCGPCASMRESKVIEENVLSVRSAA